MANNTQKKKPITTTEPIEKDISLQEPIIPKDIDPNTIVTVHNGFQGALVYKSPRTGEKFRWSSFGDEQEMELRELRNAKSSKKSFFINNWFMFDDDNAWVIDYLGLKQYYKNAIKLEDFDELFQKPVGEMKKFISGLSAGQKQSVSYRARQLVANEEIDSRKTITALEEALGVELIER